MERKSNEKRERRDRPQKPIRVDYFTGTLGCKSCGYDWVVTDLIADRKTVSCPICGALNDIQRSKAFAKDAK
jgi:transcription elongation factor Elf1